MSTQEQRERFEVEYRNAFPMTTSMRDRFTRDECGDYEQAITHVAWILFQRAEAAAIERCAKYIDCPVTDSGTVFAKAIRALLPKEE